MIYISAGHHIASRGAKFENITEFDLTQQWATHLVELLGDKCRRVPNGKLASKIDYINKHCSRDDIACEIHFNSAKIWEDLNKDGIIDDDELKHVGRGSETLYYPGSRNGLMAASGIQDVLGNIMSPNRGAKEGYYRMNPNNDPDYFLQYTKCIAVIVEPEFIDNQDKINNNFDAACHAIAEGLLEAEYILKGS